MTGITEAEGATIPSVLYAAAERYGDLEAVVESDRRVSFAGLAGAVTDVARALIASGVESGDRVAIWAPNSLDWIVTSFAIYSCGAILVPLNTRFKGDEAGHVLRTAQVRLLFTVTDFLGTDYVRMLDGRRWPRCPSRGGRHPRSCFSPARRRGHRSRLGPIRSIRVRWTSAGKRCGPTTPATSSSRRGRPVRPRGRC